MRAVLLAVTAAVLLAVVSAATAARSSSPWVAYLAPPGVCPGAARARTSAAVQRRAMTCLVNWTRRRAGLRRLGWSAELASAADAKARVVVRCDDFSHVPCGMRWPAVSKGSRTYDVWGENLYLGTRGLRSPRAAMLGWLESPRHRAILFGRAWRDLGVTVLPAPSLGRWSGVALWVLEVAGRI